ncbi:MAG: Kelch repeat-containing protein [Methylocystis sp.]|uniref:Kelch repeat-containing protein n=1 Tax=Methylocystis sp. TaxID=1911079 RepID=UPI003DA5956D
MVRTHSFKQFFATALSLAVAGLPISSVRAEQVNITLAGADCGNLVFWRNIPQMPTASLSAVGGSINGKIYAAGGLDANANPLSLTQVYQPLKNKWSSAASMPDVRYGGAAATLGDKFYVAGGWTRSPPLPNNNLWAYDPKTNAWETRSSISHLSACGAAGVINGKLYLTTPCAGSGPYQPLLDVYDPVTDQWTRLADSAKAHSDAAVGVIDGKLYVAGGFDGAVINVTERYDPDTNAWTTLAPMPIAVNLATSIAQNGLLYVFGGSGAGATNKTVQIYNPDKNSWKVCSLSRYTLPIQTRGVAGVAYGFIFAAGGGKDTSLQPASTGFSVLPLPSLP